MTRRRAVVTSSVRGIGHVMAITLADDGFDVVGGDLNDPDDPAPFTAFETCDLADPDATIAVKQRALLSLARAWLPPMVGEGLGWEVNITSVGARTGGVSQSGVYDSAKAAIVAMTKFLARNYGHVTVNDGGVMV